jgi:predicted O-methyltransferase YrrM
MLRPDVYRAIHATALEMPGGDAVEIGTSRGAATVAIALALKASRRAGRVYTIERVGKPGSNDQKIAAIQQNFRKFGVHEGIALIMADASLAPSELPDDVSIGLLMLDCDGRIDRDFANLYDRVLPGGRIVIDDYEDRTHVRIMRRRRWVGVDLKHRLTFNLVNHFRENGYIEDLSVVRQTLFCRKPVTMTHKIVLDRERILHIYYDLINTYQRIDPRFFKLMVAPLLKH